MKNDKPDIEQAAEQPSIAVKIRTDVLTNTVVKDQEKGLNLLIVAMPLSTPKYQALGFLWSVISEMTTFYEACEMAAKAKKPGIIKSTMNDAIALGHNLLKP